MYNKDFCIEELKRVKEPVTARWVLNQCGGLFVTPKEYVWPTIMCPEHVEIRDLDKAMYSLKTPIPLLDLSECDFRLVAEEISSAIRSDLIKERIRNGFATDPKTRKVIEEGNLNFYLGNAVKYVIRAGKKPGNSALQDLEKAQTYLGYEIERIKTEEKEDLKGLLYGSPDSDGDIPEMRCNCCGK